MENYLEELNSKIAEAYSKVSSEWDSWVSGLPESSKHAVSIVCANVDLFLERYSRDMDEEYLLNESDPGFGKFLSELMNEYNVYDGIGGHGFVFSDGSGLNIPCDDHRIIPEDTWIEKKIITTCFDDNQGVSIRFNGNTSRESYEALLSFALKVNTEVIYWDIYASDGNFKAGGMSSLFEMEDVWIQI